MLITIINNRTNGIDGTFNDFDNVTMQLDALLINLIGRNAITGRWQGECKMEKGAKNFAASQRMKYNFVRFETRKCGRHFEETKQTNIYD